MSNVPSKDPYEIANWAAGACRLYAEHFGSSTSQFGEQLDLIVEVLRAKAKQMEGPGNGAFLDAYADALLKQSKPHK